MNNITLNKIQAIAHADVLRATIANKEKQLEGAGIAYEKCAEPKNRDDILEIVDLLEAHSSRLSVLASLGGVRLFQSSMTPDYCPEIRICR